MGKEGQHAWKGQENNEYKILVEISKEDSPLYTMFKG